MNTTLLNPGKFKKFPYQTTRGRRKIGIEIESTSPIDVFIVQASDLENWRDSENYGGLGFMSRKSVQAQVNVPKDFERDWFLILENRGDKAAAVHYELFDL